MDEKRVALVTGANRGIGFEVCRQLAQQGMTVLLGARDVEKGEMAAKELAAEGLDVRFRQLDVAQEASIRQLAEAVEREFGKLDVLVNNAAINFDMREQTRSADLAVVAETLQTNLFGAWRLAQVFLLLLKKSGHGRIVNVSSEAGSFLAPGGLVSAGGQLPAYGVSKAALNALTVKLAADLKGDGILVNAVCPGFTASHPGTAEMGARPVPEGAAAIVWAALLPDNGPTGSFTRDGKPLPW